MATGGALIIPYSTPCIDNNGDLVVGATLTINIAGGGLATIYSNASLTTPIANPLTSDSAGRFVAQSSLIWADDSQAYDCFLNYNNGTSFSFLSLYTVGPAPLITGFAPINSPAFTGVPTAPTPGLSDSSQKIATTGFVKGQQYAPLNSPALTGVPTAPTAAAATNTTQVATTAFVETAIGLTAPTSPSSGYVEFLGLFLQWTTFSVGSAPSATVTVNWPIAFPTQVVGLPWVQEGGTGGYGLGVGSVTTTQATLTKNASDPSAHTGTVFALGN